MTEDIRFAAAVDAAKLIVELDESDHPTGRALRFGQITFAVLDAIYDAERKLAELTPCPTSPIEVSDGR